MTETTIRIRAGILARISLWLRRRQRALCNRARIDRNEANDYEPDWEAGE